MTTATQMNLRVTGIFLMVCLAIGTALIPTETRATGTADAKIIEVCRFTPLTANASVTGAFKTVFAVRVTNVGGTVSDGPLLAAVGQNAAGRQKSGGVPVTTGPLESGQTVRFKLADTKLFPGIEMRIFATFNQQTNPAEAASDNNFATFADPWAVPAC
jgi:hypothetical protein